MKLKLLYVLRHGQTEWNVQRRMQGRLNSPLTAEGRTQADAHGKVLKQLGGVDKLWVSTAGRTKQTAELVNAHLQAPVEYSEDLVERDCGIWSGKTLSEVEQEDGEGLSALRADPYGYRPGGGENLADLSARVAPVIQRIKSIERAAIISHGVVTKALLEHFLQLSREEVVRITHPNDLFFRLSFNDEGHSCDRFVLSGSRAGAPQSGPFVNDVAPTQPIQSE
jgi:probable phosphoglycerate mutase